MKTCRAVARVEPLGAVVLCGKPAFKIHQDVPVCFDHWKELNKR